MPPFQPCTKRLNPTPFPLLLLALRLAEAEELDAGRAARLRERLLDAVEVRLQVLVAGLARVRLRDLVVQLRQRLLRRRRDVARERLVYELNFQRCLARDGQCQEGWSMAELRESIPEAFRPCRTS